MQIVTVQLVLDCSAHEANDTVCQILRKQQRDLSPTSNLLDYVMSQFSIALRIPPASYKAGGAFKVI